MTILDTNVLSELMKASPSVSVVRWVAEQSPSSLYITSVKDDGDACVFTDPSAPVKNTSGRAAT